MTTCARCGAELGSEWPTARLSRRGEHHDHFGGNGFDEGPRDYCDACFVRVRVALDWALGGDGGFDAAYIERLESVCCAVKFDEGTGEWQREVAIGRRLELPIDMRDGVGLGYPLVPGDIVYLEGGELTRGADHGVVTFAAGRRAGKSSAARLALAESLVEPGLVSTPADLTRVLSSGRPPPPKTKNPFPSSQRFNRRGNRP